MTKEEITAQVTELVAAGDVNGILNMFTMSNAATIQKYIDTRPNVIALYGSLRSQFPELAAKTDAELDTIFATPITGDELHAIQNPA